MKTGYLVEYSERESLLGKYKDKERLICSREALARLLQNNLDGTVWSARWIDAEEYRMNHEEETRTLE